MQIFSIKLKLSMKSKCIKLVGSFSDGIQHWLWSGNALWERSLAPVWMYTTRFYQRTPVTRNGFLSRNTGYGIYEKVLYL